MLSAAAKNKPEKGRGKPRYAMMILLLALLAALLWGLAHGKWLQLIRVDGTSMENTLRDGEILLVTPAQEYGRGDVVICWYPDRISWEVQAGAALTFTQHTIFVKRLVGLPGDTLEIRQGVLYVNSAPAANPRDMGSLPRDMEEITLGPDEYFVMGDNRLSSHDSRAQDVGPISGSMLRGRVRKVIWPLSMWRNVE